LRFSFTSAYFAGTAAHLHQQHQEQTMETTKEEGALREATGNVQQAAGDLLGAAGAQVSGKAKELTGKAQQLYADFGDVLREATVERPFAALAIAAGVGFVLGALRKANRPQPDDVRDRKR
jgi:uncharacterized protein YjbJ (UPF0337 family)